MSQELIQNIGSSPCENNSCYKSDGKEFCYKGQIEAVSAFYDLGVPATTDLNEITYLGNTVSVPQFNTNDNLATVKASLEVGFSALGFSLTYFDVLVWNPSISSTQIVMQGTFPNSTPITAANIAFTQFDLTLNGANSVGLLTFSGQPLLVDIEGKVTKWFTCDLDGNIDPTTIEWRDCTDLRLIDSSLVSECLPVDRVSERTHENFVVTGTTPLVILSGAISISVTKTNTTGVVNISGDNGTNFPLTFNRENFTDSVNEEVSTLSAYTIAGTLAGTTYKVHIIR